MRWRTAPPPRWPSILALSLVPLVGVTIALVSRWLPLDLSASIEEVLRAVLPAASHVGPGEVLRWARSSASQGWLTVGFVVALWTSFRFMSLCIRSLGTMVSTDVRPPVKAWRSAARSLLLLVVWIVALVATALFLLVAPAIERGLLRLPKLSELLALGLLGAAGAPHRRRPFRRDLPDLPRGRRHAGGLVSGWHVAALLASLGWIGASRGFSLAVPVLWKATQLYGTLGSVVLFLIWAYVMAWVLLLGGFLLVRPGRPRAASQTDSAPPGLERGKPAPNQRRRRAVPAHRMRSFYLVLRTLLGRNHRSLACGITELSCEQVNLRMGTSARPLACGPTTGQPSRSAVRRRGEST